MEIIKSTSTEVPSTGDHIKIPVDTPALYSGLGLLITACATGIWKYYIQPKVKSLKYSFHRTIENDIKTNGRLYIILEKFRASRVLLYQAHNGSTYSSGQHQWKVSCTHEAVSNGISSLKYWCQSEGSSDFIENRPHILDTEKSFLKTDNTSMDSISEFKHRCIDSGIKAILTKVVRGYNKGEIIGFIEIHWSDNRNIPDKINAADCLTEEVDRISGLLLKNNENAFLKWTSKKW